MESPTGIHIQKNIDVTGTDLGCTCLNYVPNTLISLLKSSSIILFLICFCLASRSCQRRKITYRRTKTNLKTILLQQHQVLIPKLKMVSVLTIILIWIDLFRINIGIHFSKFLVSINLGFVVCNRKLMFCHLIGCNYVSFHILYFYTFNISV